MGRSGAPGFTSLRRGWWPTGVAARLLLTAAILVGVVAPLGLSVLTGSIQLPHNDAWSHALIAQTFAETGRFELVGWNRSSLAGQVVVLGPWGDSLVVQQVWVALLAGIGLLATQRLVATRSSAVAGATAALTVAVIPEFGLLATSYMADMPAFAAVVLAATIADTALASGSQGVLALALVVGLWGVTIREQTLIAPVAIGLAALWTFQGRPRLAVFGQSLLAGLAFLTFEFWRRTLPAGDAPSFDLSVWGPIHVIAGGVLTFCLMTGPIVLSCALDRAYRRWMTVLAFALGAGIAAVWVSIRWTASLLGNYVTISGAYPQASIGSRTVLPEVLWGAAMVMAVITAGWMCALVASRVGARAAEHALKTSSAPRTDVLVPLMLVLLVIGTLVQSAAGQATFSRYLLPAVPLAASLLTPLWSKLSPFGWIALTLNVVLGAILTADALSHDAARWRAAERLVAEGVAPDSVNAGLEWVGTHAELPALQGRDGRPGSVTPWLMAMFPQSAECYVVSADPSLELPRVGELEYRRWAVAGEGQVYVYEQLPCR